MTSPRIITSNNILFSQYDALEKGDYIIGRIRLRKKEEHLFLDLIERGVILFPSASSQLASRSKTYQTRLFSSFMVPHSLVIYDLNGLLEATSIYHKEKVEKVVLKHDRKNGGLGIHLFRSIEDIYTLAATKTLSFPFVIQPYLDVIRDIRVIFLGDYMEAYERKNQDNFRNNLHCGGISIPCNPSETQLALCRQVMERGNFPYAHLDLMVTADNKTWLTEINLRGGIRGAAIKPAEYRERVAAIQQQVERDIDVGLKQDREQSINPTKIA